jgi:hypothetical protein
MIIKKLIASDDFKYFSAWIGSDIEAMQYLFRLWDYCIEQRTWILPFRKELRIAEICKYEGDYYAKMDFFAGLMESGFIDYTEDNKRLVVTKFVKYNRPHLRKWLLPEREAKDAR